MIVPRSSGVQLHVTSLPSGRLDRDAYAFVDWLAAAGQSFWQVLPLGPPDGYGSPYRSRSAFACSPALLADPGAPVCAGEEDDLLERERFWIGDWAAFAGGRRAIADQVRFAREWERLRAYAAGAGVRLFGDLPLYIAAGSADHRAHPELFQRGRVAGAPPGPRHQRPPAASRSRAGIDQYATKPRKWSMRTRSKSAIERRSRSVHQR